MFEYILNDFLANWMPDQSRTSGKNEGREKSQMKEHFNVEEKAFFIWLSSIMQQSAFDEIKQSFKIISLILMQKNVLQQPIIETKQIKQHMQNI